MSERRPGASRPPVRLRPVPPIDPPYQDETYWSGPTHGQLALDLFASTRPDPVRPPVRRSVARRTPAHPAANHPGVSLPPTTASEATRAAHRFVGTCLEVVNGYRSPAQVRPLLDPARAVELLTELARATGRAGPARRRATRPALRLLRLRVCEPREAAVEAAAVVSGPGGRSWAMALRLEHRRGRWLCTALHVL
ncbi:Rv3235 family protein [Micromonospora sp. WMMD729]|uniref:Rv3235 family protein n=1 Tax=Micromonospora sp. WMMD729 TaxID=3404127 RepID=UPI003BF55259